MNGPDMAHRFDMVRGSVMTKGRPRLSDINGLVGITIGLLRPRFLRFLLVGALNTAFGYAIFLLSLKLGMSVGAALSASTLAGVVFNFQTSRRLVFRSAGNGAASAFLSASTPWSWSRITWPSSD
jgi:GtrA-like protein.